MASKKFFIFEVVTAEHPSTSIAHPYKFMMIIEGAVGDARDKIGGLGQGQFLVLEDTSGIITVTSETTTKTVVSFDPPRKKERKPKIAKPEAAKKNATPPAGKTAGA